ncbi:MAG: hypothetical protein DMG49_21095 [Acidobacteria bacterium]|nr:MAG: hypothetical protein DMG49_21095 [Acidobacteriota bacterium]
MLTVQQQLDRIDRLHQDGARVLLLPGTKCGDYKAGKNGNPTSAIVLSSPAAKADIAADPAQLDE